MCTCTGHSVCVLKCFLTALFPSSITLNVILQKVFFHKFTFAADRVDLTENNDIKVPILYEFSNFIGCCFQIPDEALE